MNLDDYEKKYFWTYQAFAETVRFIMEKALKCVNNPPRLQSIQCRAKEIDSLRRRLKEAGKLDTQTLEADRRDLAGVRLIFYTNNDVDRFRALPVIWENFDIEEGSTKIHHPTRENSETRYRAEHYTVRLRQDRLSLPEYASFAGFRCEIQVHTILNHAWSETSHDILYKDTVGDGFGRKAIENISRRFERIMDEYLIPAGFEIQKAQQDYERLLQGRELFDRDIATLLDDAQNNNERYEILSGLRDYAIPHYDDLLEAYDGLKGPFLRAVRAARSTEPVPIETTFGALDGCEADAVTRLVVEIVESLRHVDVTGTLQLLIDIYRDEPNDDIRQQIVNAAKRLSEYNVDAFNKVGPMLQMALVDHLASMSSVEVDRVRPIAITVWTAALELDITGTEGKADSVIFKFGTVPDSDQLRVVRDKAIAALFAAYDRSSDDAQKCEVLSALDTATTTPSHRRPSNVLMALTLTDAARIVSFVTDRAKSTSYELLQHLEHRFLNDYFRAKRLSEDVKDQFGCQAEASVLVTAILTFRDAINGNSRFVRYKVLVGYESVFPGHWTSEESDYKAADEYRAIEVDRYIEEIDAASESEWFGLIARCAQAESNDLAAFPALPRLIRNLGERKPDVADRLLASAPDELGKFLPAFIKGLSLSGRSDIYERILESELERTRNLGALASYLRRSDVSRPEFATRLLERAIAKDDSLAVTECLLFSMEHYGTEKIADVDAFVRDALSFLNEHEDTRWVKHARFLEAPKFYKELTTERTAQVLQNLHYLPRVDYQDERVLTRLAEHQAEAVWDYFGARLAREAAEDEEEGKFEAVPFRLHGLEKELSKDPQLGIRKGLSWFARERRLFEFRGGRLLSNAFPACTPEFAAALVELVKAGGDTEADFALAILRNYRGKTSTHVVLKEIVSRFSDNDSRMSQVCMTIDSTGVVTGEFGIADAYRAKKDAMGEWLTDDRPAVKAFGEKHIAQLELMITLEQRRVENEREMRNRDYEDEDEDEDEESEQDDDDGCESTA